MGIYLDHAATTFPDPKVLQAVSRCCQQGLGNASAQHRAGVQAAMVVEHARQVIAGSIHADSQELYFFSGGTEVNNAVMKGIAGARRKYGRHIIVSAIEHPSILEPARWLEKQGFRVSYVPVDRQGRVDPDDIRRSMTKKTILVSVMQANNEIGTVQPVKAIGQLCRQQGVYFHTDASQSFTKIPIDVRRDYLDLVTLSSHKVHGPKGVGALYMRQGIQIDPLMHGGSHEHGIRAGTYNTEGIAGFGKAVEISDRRDIVRMRRLRDYFIRQVEMHVPGARLNGSRQARVCNNVNFSFEGLTGKGLFSVLNKKNIFVATGSACASNELKVSHVLQALGIGQERANGAVRMTLSKWTTKKEIDAVVKAIRSSVNKIRVQA